MGEQIKTVQYRVEYSINLYVITICGNTWHFAKCLAPNEKVPYSTRVELEKIVRAHQLPPCQAT